VREEKEGIRKILERKMKNKRGVFL